MWSFRRAGYVAVLLGGVASSDAALAYPTSVVFAPTGDVKGQANVGAFAYTSMVFGPSLAPSVSWLGIEAGLLPRIAYGSSGLSFGGLEVGIDVFNDIDYSQNRQPFIKPVVNAKMQLLVEKDWAPNVSIGAMSLALFSSHGRSQNALYGSLTKTLQFGETLLGRVTLGMAKYLTADPTVFTGTAPFTGMSVGLLGGYESPAFGPFSVGVDHVGGYGEINSTNAALNFTPIEGGTISVGAFFSNRREPGYNFDGAFAYLYLSGDFTKVFKPQPAPPPEAPIASSPNVSGSGDQR